MGIEQFEACEIPEYDADGNPKVWTGRKITSGTSAEYSGGGGTNWIIRYPKACVGISAEQFEALGEDILIKLKRKGVIVSTGSPGFPYSIEELRTRPLGVGMPVGGDGDLKDPTKYDSGDLIVFVDRDEFLVYLDITPISETITITVPPGSDTDCSTYSGGSFGGTEALSYEETYWAGDSDVEINETYDTDKELVDPQVLRFNRIRYVLLTDDDNEPVDLTIQRKMITCFQPEGGINFISGEPQETVVVGNTQATIDKVNAALTGMLHGDVVIMHKDGDQVAELLSFFGIT